MFKRPTPPCWITRLAFALASGALGLVAGEVLLRELELPKSGFEFLSSETTDETVFERDPLRFWRLRADAPGLRVNRHGLRGYWPESPKRAGQLRIACVGDSCTFGTNVRYEETYGLWLERELAESRPDLDAVSVLAALPGYSSYQSLLLFDEALCAFEPDWTLIYCGGWNDYVAAVGQSDRERAEGLGRSNLLELIEQQFGTPTSRDELLRGMQTGHYLDGARVPLDDFRDNLRALVARANETGRALLIVPPVPASTRAKYPVGEAYRQAVRELAEQTGTPLVDGTRLFDMALESVPEDWRLDPRTGESLYFSDWIHPSAVGHELLGRALLAELSRELPAFRPLPVEPLALRGSDYLALPAFEAREIVLESEEPLDLERVWLGRAWLDGLTLDGAGRTRVRLPLGLVPGEHTLWLHTRSGLRRAELRPRVYPPALFAELEREGDGFRLRARVTAEPGMLATVWLALELREVPEPTRFGPFALAAEPDGRPPGRSDLPFRFERVPFGFSGEVDEAGVWVLDKRLEVDLEGVERLFAQGGFLRAGPQPFGALTEVVELAVPR